jgi:hypothetical protein
MKDYKDVRSKIRTGDVFFTASNALFSRMVRLVRRSTVSHVGVFYVLKGRIFVIECLEGKDCRMMLASERFKNKKLIHKKGKKFHIDPLIFVGRIKYNLTGALLSPFVRLKSDEKFCSTFTAMVFGIKLKHLKRDITPDDLLTYFS